MPVFDGEPGCRTQEPRAAAGWLEWGRARVLSDALDRARLAALAGSHPDLVRRYRAAARLNARQPGEATPAGG